MTLPLVHLPYDDRDHTPGGDEKIEVTLCDKTFWAGRRTAAHIEATIAAIEAKFAGTHLHAMQTCYHTGYKLSEGTHDGDGVLDWRLLGFDQTLAQWWAFQYQMRLLGWDCWFRHTGDWADPSTWHVHGISDGCPGPVGYYIPAQVDDYGRHSLGLKGQHNSGEDHSMFPNGKPSDYRFDYAGSMALSDADLAKINALIVAERPNVVAAVLAANVASTDNSLALSKAINQIHTHTNPK